jgi:hypothetical protein
MKIAQIAWLALLASLAGCTLGKNHPASGEDAKYVRTHPSDEGHGQTEAYQPPEEALREPRAYYAPHGASFTPHNASRSLRVESAPVLPKSLRVAPYSKARARHYALQQCAGCAPHVSTGYRHHLGSAQQARLARSTATQQDSTSNPDGQNPGWQ